MNGGHDRGALRHVLVVEVRSFVPDGVGGFDEVWTPLDTAPTLYASIQALSADDRARGRGVTHQTEYKLVTTYRADIVAGMRLGDAARYYEIVSVLDRSQRREYLEIRATSEG